MEQGWLGSYSCLCITMVNKSKEFLTTSLAWTSYLGVKKGDHIDHQFGSLPPPPTSDKEMPKQDINYLGGGGGAFSTKTNV